MKLYYAHYPALEDSLVRFVRQTRTHVLDKWLIIGASSGLCARLQTRLARELGGLANMHFITGASLVGRLDREVPGPTLPILPQNHLRDFLIQELLTRPGLDRYPVSSGFVQAVKSALRDLADSLADPDVLAEHWQSMPDYVLEQDGGRFRWLIELYKCYTQAENSVPGYRSYQVAFERALEQVENSAYLHSFSHIIIYGFYDMPGRQWELLSRLRSAYPVTVFAPYAKHPAYNFAQKFFETNWLAVPPAQDENTPFQGALGASAPYLFAAGGSAPNAQITITSVPDANGAVFYTAKEILRCIEEGTSPGDIGIIVRSLSPYQDEIRRVFKANCLPLDASFSYPLTKYALGNFCLNLLSLAAHGFSRENILAVFSSPYFKQPDKAAWRRLVQQSAVQRDLAQWRELLPTQNPNTAAVQTWITHAAQTLQTLQRSHTWEEGVNQLLEFLSTQVDENSFVGKDSEIFAAVKETLLQMKQYSFVRAQSREGELLRQATQALNALTFNEVEQVRGGITVTDALRARGLQFKRVFLLGLNDKEFPQMTPEDPILRDYYRYQLRDTLGYWINASLDRGDEEKLLFYNAVTAAREKLVVCYARYAQDGKPAVPSVYVAQLARACELNLQAADAPRVSGRLSERLRAYSAAYLTPQEMACQIVLAGHAQTHLEQAGLLSEVVKRSLASAENLSGGRGLTAYDGLIRQGKEVFARENARGFSPSALQELGTCPQKYFFNRVLGLGEPDKPASRHELSADKRGSGYHAILQDFYQTLQAQHVTHALFDTGAEKYIAQSIARIYTPNSYQLFGIYPVVWELILETISAKLTDFVTEDLKNLGDFTPAFFEQTVSAEPTAALPIKLRGIIDRIDVNDARKQFYIADYKSSRKGSGKLVSDIFTHLILQPFIYVLLAKQLPQLKDYTSAGSCLLAIANYKKAELSAAEFEEIFPKACALLVGLCALIKQGQFFICPSDLCTYCPYSQLCRKDAFKPLLRARQSQTFATLEELKK